ncbi:hypothetical protein BIZ37_28140 [Photobacterium sp. BZF1]|uniref:VapA family S-layer protein n=1 Tax=Photobacterium sp. BZF1 TaxID=1904457 RepID=UPI00165344ED|nr:hypothetical protein [Photobacterium sp. BZF1]MBC7006429.1 hypothetical protein [Photobacterium sp. BZF1]
MFKKTVIAAALTLGMVGTASAYDYTGTMVVSSVASQSTQTVLEFQTANDKIVNPIFTVTEGYDDSGADVIEGEIPPASFVRIELSGGATWNLDKINDFKDAIAVETATSSSLLLDSAELLNTTTIAVPVLKPAVLGDGFSVDLKHSGMFNLQDAAGSASVSIGVQRLDGSFSINPRNVGQVFKLVDVVSVVDSAAEVDTASVADQYMVFKTPTDSTKPSAITGGSFSFSNNTTNQTVNQEDVTVIVSGDFTNVVGDTYPSVGGTTEWKVNADRTAFITKLNGAIQPDTGKNVISVPAFEFNGETPIVPQALTATFRIDSTSPTFTTYSIDDVTNIIDRDGFRFDTVTTGTTANNTIYIRDVSGNIPAEGGKVNVTVWQYENGESTVLAESKPLSMVLPSNGALTLSPQDITADLGIEITPEREARFLFEVETANGEASVMKRAGGGIDIQTTSSDDNDFSTL